MATSMLLPLDVIIDVLIRLPVKIPLRFRCVSKSFRSVIDRQDFIKLHLNRSVKTNSNRSLLLSPLTEKHRVLPKFIYRDLSGLELSFSGFGYDVGSGGYKCVKIIWFPYSWETGEFLD